MREKSFGNDPLASVSVITVCCCSVRSREFIVVVSETGQGRPRCEMERADRGGAYAGEDPQPDREAAQGVWSQR